MKHFDHLARFFSFDENLSDADINFFKIQALVQNSIQSFVRENLILKPSNFYIEVLGPRESIDDAVNWLENPEIKEFFNNKTLREIERTKNDYFEKILELDFNILQFTRKSDKKEFQCILWIGEPYKNDSYKL